MLTNQTKRCSKCKQTKKLSEFYTNKSEKSGYNFYCKTCWRKYQKNYKWHTKNPKGHKAARRRYVNTNKGRLNKRTAQMRYQRGEVGKIAHNKKAKEYGKRYPEKTKAHSAVHYAIKKGKLKKVSACSCVYCGETAQQYHHPDYSKPLEVEPICRSCHKNLHILNVLKPKVLVSTP